MKHTSIFLGSFVFLAALVAGEAKATALCQAIQYYVTASNTVTNPHNAILVTDPNQEQTAVFDLYWGGVLVSLKYQGNEYIDQTNLANGSALQLAMFYGTGSSAWNPTQAGGNPWFPSAVLGASCNGLGEFNMWTGTLDYNKNASGMASVFGVFGSGLELGDGYSGGPPWPTPYNGYLTPYVIQTDATWVSNPAGANPTYYLKLAQRVTNVGAENHSWAFDLAAYFSANLTSKVQSPVYCTPTAWCSNGATDLPLLVGGYTSASTTIGAAIGINAPSPLLSTGRGWWATLNTGSTPGTDVHLASGNNSMPPGQQYLFNWYVMLGPWANARSFMQNHS